MFVCPSGGMWRTNGNPTPSTNLDEILHTLETLKAEGHIFKILSRLQINPGSTGYLS